MDGMAVKSCTILAVQADGSEITTIEGLATNGQLHPVQEGFKECHGLQCGFCTTGMIMTAVDLLNQNPRPYRIRNPSRPRGQLLPLHGLPQHRAQCAVGGGEDEGGTVSNEEQ